MDEIMGIARQEGGSLKRQLAVYIDEFANIGKLDDAGSWFGTMRSYNIAFTIACASSKLPSMAMLWTLGASTVVI